MITLPTSIQVTPPALNIPGKPQKTFPSITLTAIDYSVSYDNTQQRATAYIKKLNRSILLWKGADYVAAGQFADADTDARLSQLLGSDPAAVLTALFK